jgi:hypothetical protein
LLPVKAPVKFSSIFCHLFEDWTTASCHNRGCKWSYSCEIWGCHSSGKEGNCHLECGIAYAAIDHYRCLNEHDTSIFRIIRCKTIWGSTLHVTTTRQYSSMLFMFLGFVKHSTYYKKNVSWGPKSSRRWLTKYHTL